MEKKREENTASPAHTRKEGKEEDATCAACNLLTKQQRIRLQSKKRNAGLSPHEKKGKEKKRQQASDNAG